MKKKKNKKKIFSLKEVQQYNKISKYNYSSIKLYCIVKTFYLSAQLTESVFVSKNCKRVGCYSKFLNYKIERKKKDKYRL